MTTLTRQEIHWIIGNLDKDIYRTTVEKENCKSTPTLKTW